MAVDPAALPPAALEFLAERHLATLTTLDAGGRPHVVPVGFTWDPDERVARVITFAGSVKYRHARRGGWGALCQVDGARWLTLEGSLRAVDALDTARVRRAVDAYAERYRPPKARPDRVAVELHVDRVRGQGRLLAGS